MISAASRGFRRKFIIFSNEDSGFEEGGKPSGYVKLEVRDKMGSLLTVIQNLRNGNGKFGYALYLIRAREGATEYVRAGEIKQSGGRAELDLTFDNGNFGGLSHSADDFDTFAVLVESENGIGVNITCPLAAYRNGRTNWRDGLRKAMQLKMVKPPQKAVQMIQQASAAIPQPEDEAGHHPQVHNDQMNSHVPGTTTGYGTIPGFVQQYNFKPIDYTIQNYGYNYPGFKTDYKQYELSEQYEPEYGVWPKPEPIHEVEPVNKTESSAIPDSDEQMDLGKQPYLSKQPYSGEEPYSADQTVPDAQMVSDVQPYSGDQTVPDAQMASDVQSYSGDQTVPDAQMVSDVQPYSGDQTVPDAQMMSDVQSYSGDQTVPDAQPVSDVQPYSGDQTVPDAQPVSDVQSYSASQPIADNYSNITAQMVDTADKGSNPAPEMKVQEPPGKEFKYPDGMNNLNTECVYLNGNLCGSVLNNGDSADPCGNCRINKHEVPAQTEAQPQGNLNGLEDELDRNFEISDPFHSRRSDYIWWRVTNPVNLNNMFYQNNIRSPLMFNPAVMMAHYKYKHLIVGVFTHKTGQRYIVCGVPAMHVVDPKPFGEMSRWVQAEGNRLRYGAFGYWLVYINPKDGKIINFAQ